jgi:hypothetical protein
MHMHMHMHMPMHIKYISTNTISQRDVGTEWSNDMKYFTNSKHY